MNIKKAQEREHPSCEDLVEGKLERRLLTLRQLWNTYTQGEEDEELGSFHEYGLSFDYVAPGTFGEEQREGYFRYQLSWGGPSDEFRFFVGPGFTVYRIEYWYMDWFDGASRELSGEDSDLLDEIFTDFHEMGMVESQYEDAMEDMEIEPEEEDDEDEDGEGYVPEVDYELD